MKSLVQILAWRPVILTEASFLVFLSPTQQILRCSSVITPWPLYVKASLRTPVIFVGLWDSVVRAAC